MGFLRYAVTASAILLGCQPALALPQANEVVPPPLSAWVSVDEAGGAVTMIPAVNSKNGAATTLYPPPSTLMATGTYTLLPNGIATTKTGLAPVATATGKNNEAGIFLACNRYQGPGGAICQPEPGTVLYVGHTYYVTWSPAHFSDGNSKIYVSAEYENGWGEKSGDPVPASKGFWAWDIEENLLRVLNRTAIAVTLSIMQDETSTPEDNDFQKIVGPTVYIEYPPPLVPVKGNGPSVIAIAVPVVVAVVVLLLAGLCFWSWRRHGTVPLVGALGKVSRRSSGYGVRKSASERVGRGAAGIGGGAFGASGDKARPNINIQLTDRDSWSPTGTGNTRNVFREEMQRQERQR